MNNIFSPIFADKAETLIAKAAAYGSQLVVFPEAFIGGYPRGSTFGVTIGSRSAKGREEFRKYHAAAIDVPGILYFILFSINIDNEFFKFFLKKFLDAILTIYRPLFSIT